MKAYFDSVVKEVPQELRSLFLDPAGTAVVTIDMHDGHLSEDPDCPCPSPRGREIVEPLNAFMAEARALGLPVIHVRATLRRGGVDEKLYPSAWRYTFPICVTDCCVINSAFDAANRDFRVVVPRDLTRGSEHLEEPALRIISMHLGLVVDSAGLLEEWKHWS